MTSAVDRVNECQRRVDTLNPSFGAFREVYRDRALERAAAVDTGKISGPLAGMPIAVKDNIATDYGHTSCGSRFLEAYQSPFTATAVQRLEDAGAIIVGKTNCDEFGMGSSSEHCAFGAVRNPWDVNRTPGGSSGGSAAAVAAGMVTVALGSDTGGSIRQPASMCGVVGLKPTYGRVSRWGLVAFGSSLDQIGPIAANVRDAAAVYTVMAGVDEKDSTTSRNPVSMANDHASDDGLRVGIVADWVAAVDAPVRMAIDRSIEVFRDRGAEIVNVDLPMSEYGIATYYIIAPAEASSNLARYDGMRFGRRATLEEGEGLIDLYEKSRTEGFGDEVKRRILLGTFVLSAGYYDAYYKRALQVRRLIRDDFARAFTTCDVILGPTTCGPAFALGAMQDPMDMYMCDLFTVNANIAGLCAISLPVAWTNGDKPLPLGVQLHGRAFDEQTLLRAAMVLEGGLKFQRPEVSCG